MTGSLPWAPVPITVLPRNVLRHSQRCGPGAFKDRDLAVFAGCHLTVSRQFQQFNTSAGQSLEQDLRIFKELEHKPASAFWHAACLY